MCECALTRRARLHQAQYVAKLEDILRFLVTEQRLTTEHLDLMWKSQVRNRDWPPRMPVIGHSFFAFFHTLSLSLSLALSLALSFHLQAPRLPRLLCAQPVTGEQARVDRHEHLQLARAPCVLLRALAP